MLTVASVPSAHPYVSSVLDTSRVRALPDPVPVGATMPGQWWPPRLLEPDYLLRHVTSFNVMHVHFGFEGATVEVLKEVVGILKRHRVPLVLTVHDLHNPHVADPTLHLAQLDVLVPAATVVITLTHGAAAVIRGRWDEECVVLAHPHVLPIGAVGAARPWRQLPIVAVHGKGLRANIFPWPVVDALMDGALPNCRIRFDLDREALDSPGVSVRLHEYRRSGLDVRVHSRFTDAELIEYLTDVDVAVLPYRFGTHSGWVEACYDAGTTVVTPDCGFFSEQHCSSQYGYGADGLDTASLLHAVAAGLASFGGDRGVDLIRRKHRAQQRDWVRDCMVDLYDLAIITASAP